jgi:glycosyltransferase involved in cell wall biosynthesis
LLTLPAKRFDEMHSVYYDHDVLVLPSRFDGWGVVVNEAVACGRAVIVTRRCGSAGTLALNNVNGFVCETSVESLYLALLHYCERPELLVSHGEASRRLHSVWNADALAARVIDWLRHSV